MSYVAAVPEIVALVVKGILTIILPLPNGCNLNCPYCYIARRNEDGTVTRMRPGDFVRFIAEAHEAGLIKVVCIQGYEFTHPECRDYLIPVLEVTNRRRLPLCGVTNGVALYDVVPLLAQYGMTYLAVSIMSDNPAFHDRNRRKDGAHEAATRGLRYASTIPELKRGLTIAAIYFPGKVGWLLGLPAWMDALDIRRLTVTCLQVRKSDGSWGTIGNRQQTIYALLTVRSQAHKYGIQFHVDDELCNLSTEGLGLSRDEIEGLRLKRIKSADVSRLLPNGQLLVREQILETVHPGIPAWNLQTNAAMFLQTRLAA